MKTILVLGGYGFIATNIIKYIDNYYPDNYQVIVFDRIKTHPYNVTFNCIKAVYTGDFNDENCIEQIFKQQHIDVVIHALSSTVPASSSNAQYDVSSNLIPTLKLLGIMDRHQVKDIFYLSSGGAIYGDAISHPHREDEAVYPKSSYGVVKLAIEKYLLCYAELYGFRPLILRVSNPYGKYHFNEKQGIINVAIRKALRGDTIQVWGSGEGQKDYIYVEDLAKIICLFLSEDNCVGIYNTASGFLLSVNEILASINHIIPSCKYEHVEASLTDVQSFQLDTTCLLKKFPGFKFTSFENALKQTIDWAKNE